MSEVHRPTIAYAGGGTGGHIYPNVGIAEAFADRRPNARGWFVVSDRIGDAKTLDGLGLEFTVTPARPLPSLRKPSSALTFVTGWARSAAMVARMLKRERAKAVVATGGFVCGPAVMAARLVGIPAVMVNLDAVPGAANRAMVRLCHKVFTAHATHQLPGAEVVGLPLRRVALGSDTPEAARRALSLDPDRRTLFITGATHGAESIIHAMMTLVANDPRFVTVLREGWQVLHQCGTFDPAPLKRAYDEAGITARVVDYLSAMGQAFAASDLVVSRAGAGSVAEAWANGTPTVFIPNPYHADQHQRHNAQPMADAGAAVIVPDAIDPDTNAGVFGPVLTGLLTTQATRDTMRACARATAPTDGAAAVAGWLDSNLP